MHLAAFTEFADRRFGEEQERSLQTSERIVCCIAGDHNGYVPRHNEKYNNVPRRYDFAWNAGNYRSRRIFADRNGLASARSMKPFLFRRIDATWGAANSFS